MSRLSSHERPSGHRAAAGLLALLLAPLPVPAAEIVLDAASGAAFAGLVDGFPGIFPFDGNADAPDRLGVGLKAGVTEERGIGEFPLVALDAVCLTPSDVAQAVLTFNIDDVLASFGPGTEFNGEAATELLVHPFAGNGRVGPADLGDFQQTAALPYVVDTTSFGTITDQTLFVSGPLRFDVDITDALTARLGLGSHLGFLWRTTDSPTGTSLDDLGAGGQGPPGVNGATLPYLTVTTRPLHLADLRCAGEPTVCTWQAEAGDVAYDLVRGDVVQLGLGAADVDLGIVTCIADDVATTTTLGNPDGETPLPGAGFFYLMRPITAAGPGGYGPATGCIRRLPLAGDCD